VLESLLGWLTLALEARHYGSRAFCFR